MNTSCENCTVAWKNFRNLTKSQLKLVDENRFEAFFKAGEIIIKQGSPATSVVFLSKGIAKAHTEGGNRKNKIVEILLPSNLIMGPGIYLNAGNFYSVSALTECNACFINLEIINLLVRQNPEFAAGLVSDLSTKLYCGYNRLIHLTQKKMEGRLAEALLFLAEAVFKTDEFDMILTRQELGELTNMAKESVVRILKSLELSGIIRSDCSRISIIDRTRLKMISEKG